MSGNSSWQPSNQRDVLASFPLPNEAQGESLSLSDTPVERPISNAAPRPSQLLTCPRCDSPDTKFCYYNNYSLSQPRYFCKSCKRYWTAGGSLRNVPVGGGLRKSKRSKLKATAQRLVSEQIHLPHQLGSSQQQLPLTVAPVGMASSTYTSPGVGTKITNAKPRQTVQFSMSNTFAPSFQQMCTPGYADHNHLQHYPHHDQKQHDSQLRTVPNVTRSSLYSPSNISQDLLHYPRNGQDDIAFTQGPFSLLRTGSPHESANTRHLDYSANTVERTGASLNAGQNQAEGTIASFNLANHSDWQWGLEGLLGGTRPDCYLQELPVVTSTGSWPNVSDFNDPRQGWM